MSPEGVLQGRRLERKVYPERTFQRREGLRREYLERGEGERGVGESEPWLYFGVVRDCERR